jgi:hypothetical protein
MNGPGERFGFRQSLQDNRDFHAIRIFWRRLISRLLKEYSFRQDNIEEQCKYGIRELKKLPANHARLAGYSFANA